MTRDHTSPTRYEMLVTKLKSRIAARHRSYLTATAAFTATVRPQPSHASQAPQSTHAISYVAPHGATFTHITDEHLLLYRSDTTPTVTFPILDLLLFADRLLHQPTIEDEGRRSPSDTKPTLTNRSTTSLLDELYHATLDRIYERLATSSESFAILETADYAQEGPEGSLLVVATVPEDNDPAATATVAILTNPDGDYSVIHLEDLLAWASSFFSDRYRQPYA